MSAEAPNPLPNDGTIARADSQTSRTALRFVLLIGVLSFFADFTYEGSRSILGPFLALLGASGTVVGVVTGFGELLGYGLRLVSGRLADATRQYWPITIFGYVVQMASVPALALVDSWPAAAVLIILERVGKAIRNPPRDVMLSHATKEMGRGWGFGVHEALDGLAVVDATAAELVKLRYFVGLTVPEAADRLGLPLRSAERLWTFSRAWLRDALSRAV